MEKLNTIKTFNDGFKIKRDNKIITLTQEEMARFRYLDKAVDGKNCLDCYNADEEEFEIIDKLRKDEIKCYEIEERVLNVLFEDCGCIESEIINNVIAEYREKR